MGFSSGYQTGQSIAKSRQQKKLGQLGQQYLGGDESAFQKIGAIDPQRARNLQIIQSQQQKQQQLNLQKGSMLAQTVLDADPDDRPEVYRATMAVAKKYGIDTTGLDDIWTDETEGYLQNVVNVSKGFKGDQRVFGKTPEGYVTDPEKEEIRKLKGFKGTPETQEKLFARTTGLRKEYAKESSEFTDVRNSYNRVQASAENPSPAGDVALLYNFMKILDPRSTVREGEFATAKNAGSISDTIRAKYNKAMEGTMLTSRMRGDFVNRAGKLYGKQELTQKKREKQYRNIAKKQGIPEEQAILDVYSDKPKPKFTPEQIAQEMKRRGL